MISPSAPNSKTLYVIVGPTAVGKTAAAIQLAQNLGTEILSADSRQCYRELNIGVARPSPGELAQVKHHFIASHSIHDAVNAGYYESYGLELLSRFFSARESAVVVGGTGLYIKALCDGIDAFPQIDTAIRSAVIQDFANFGLAWLQDQVKQHDPQFFQKGETQNPQRLMRALEVVRSTGLSINSFQTGKIAARPFDIIKYGLYLPRNELYDRINQRVDSMMANGLLQEAEAVYTIFDQSSLARPPALNTVGYTELFDYFKGKISLLTAIEQIKQHTRNYAKRQLTWFRKDTGIEWMTPADFSQKVERFTNW